MAARDHHKKAAIRNMGLTEESLLNLKDDESDEAVARAATLALSCLVHAVLYVGDALVRVADEIERKR
jgi:hypothetical protein